MARIVIIEDNPANLELMSYLLKAFGHSVVSAIDGCEGLEAVRREPPELIICDVQLPKLDGYEVARRLKSDPGLKDIPLIAVTALAMVGDRDKGLRAGFDGYISKPIEPDTFVPELEKFLRAERRGETPAPQPSPAGECPHASQRKRDTILVVDDVSINLDLARGILEPHGYRVWTADSVEQGMALVAQATPDLIVSDLEMPGADGFELLRRIKAIPRLEAIPFVLISSSMWGEKDRELARRLGAARFFLRPIEPQTLLDEIAACLANRHG
jgi:two-component system, cell cycle response regulator